MALYTSLNSLLEITQYFEGKMTLFSIWVQLKFFYCAFDKVNLGAFYRLQIDQISKYKQNTHLTPSSYLREYPSIYDSSEYLKLGFVFEFENSCLNYF